MLWTAMHIYQIFGLGRYAISMAKHDPIVERPRGNSWRTSANAPDGLRKQLYQQMLREELGRDPDFKQQEIKEPSLLASPVVIVCLAVLTFMAVLGGLLWRDGVFDRAFAWVAEAEPSSGWMLGDRAQMSNQTIAPEAPLESFVEPPPAPPVEAAAEPAE